jgi:hypothetical protein
MLQPSVSRIANAPAALTASLRARDKIGEFANFAQSEAIQKVAGRLDCFVAKTPRNDDCNGFRLSRFRIAASRRPE